ncbi:hypothetical protein RhiirC2_750161 [Rhizophagus irregularis]|uniref:Serine-threonine/tyrosine-protein kinase catalytic domain-containing protein n=1 Tax=Rhizophagus irregularis TaxID=588596 RepID=A0A2N1N3G9_9GLOM|nr:hypothetical protein RhiirC2_750161 [Rhizophagus irregularis]
MRPEIIPGTPLKYKELMKQCWDADPTKRPNIFILKDKINEMMNKVQQTADDYTNINLMNDCSVNSINRSFNSKVHDVVDLCEQRNIIKDRAYSSIQVYSSIPNNIVTENRIGQFDSPILIDDDDDEINKPKRMYWEILDGHEEDDDVIIIKHKKIKLNN